jgi:hypothetical protein
MIRAGRRVAIIAVKNSSIDLIFRERSLDYFFELYDTGRRVTRRRSLLDSTAVVRSGSELGFLSEPHRSADCCERARTLRSSTSSVIMVSDRILGAVSLSI